MQDNIKLNHHELSKKETSENSKNAHYVVGIGASAGGLEAINELFDNIPEGNGYSFVVVQHLSPNYKSLMDELLAKHTHMQIERAEEGMLILPDRVYLIPTKKNMTVKHGKLHLVDKPNDNSPNNAIDIFFESLAKDKKDKAVAVVLSGTGTDGTKGIEAIKNEGGLVIAQDPTTARFDGMPNSAIASGNVDLILPPELMSEEIFQFPSRRSSAMKFGANSTGNGENYLKEILALVKQVTFQDFSAYKEQTIQRRIAKRYSFLDIDNPREYLLYLQNNPDEIVLLGKEFLIGVTRFFRDTEAFDVIAEKVIPEILKKKTPDNPVKIWVSACSTGEEAYSLAILICEQLQHLGRDISVKIFATDMDPKAVEFGAKGVYPESIKNEVSPERLEKFFIKEGKNYCVCQQIRRMVIFAEHNLIKDPPFSKMDLVSCRNMLIYMKPVLQRKVLATFHFSLKVGGFLFLGASESSEEIKNSLKVGSKKWNIFKIVSKSKNFIFEGTFFDKEKVNFMKTPDVRPKKLSVEKEMSEVFQELVSEELGFATVFVNEEYDLIQAIGDYKRFLKIPERLLQMNLLKLVPRELSVVLNLSLRKASRSRERVVSKHIEILRDGQLVNVSVTVKPYLNADQYSKKFIAVLFKEERSKKYEQNAEDDDESFGQQVSINRLLELENELKQTKEDLQSAVEELETSNEEMQSSNEELISSNEELQSTNEELQSLNEELHTVNAEHQQKIRELEELNDDLNNYFRSTDIGQIFLDSKLVVRKFTPSIKNQVNLIETDIGRPIDHLSYNLKHEGFVDDIRQVIKNSQPVLKEIEARNGRYYLMKILPYLRNDRTTDGAVVTFVDISKVKGLNNLLGGVLNSSMNGIMAFSLILDDQDKITDLEWTIVNDAARRILNKQGQELTGKRLLRELPNFRKEGLFRKLVKVVETQKSFHQEHKYKSGEEEVCLEIVAVPIESGVAVTLIDVSEKKAAEDELIQAYEEVKDAEEKLRKLNVNLEQRVAERTRELYESEERLRLVSRATNDAVWDWNLVTNEIWWNDGFQKLFGYSIDEIEPGIRSWFSRLYGGEKERIQHSIDEAINRGDEQWSAEHRLKKADGSFAFVYNRGYILKNEYGVPFRMVGSMVDLTNLRKVQEDLQESNVSLRKINVDLDNFIYTASHDLKAPVTNLEGLVNLLIPKLDGKLDEKETKALTMIKVSVDKLNKTINGLLEITRVQKDLERKVDRLKFQEVLIDAKANVEQMIKDCNASVKSDFQVPEIYYT